MRASAFRIVGISVLLLAFLVLAQAAGISKDELGVNSTPSPSLQRRLFSIPSGDSSADVAATDPSDSPIAPSLTVDADAVASTDTDSVDSLSVRTPTRCPFAFDTVQQGQHSGDTVYTAATAAQKSAYLWSQLRVNASTADFAPAGAVAALSMDPTVHHRGDLIPLGRVKAVHGGGVVAACELRMAQYAYAGKDGKGYDLSGDSERPLYSGVLAPGKKSSHVIMRFSSVVDPIAVGAPVPSFALKFLRDGRESVNHVVLNSQTPQTDTTNPFARPMTNQFVGLPDFVQQIFGTVTQFPNFTGNSALAYPLDPDVQPINFPWQLIYVPDPELQAALPAQYEYSTSQQYYEQMLPPHLVIKPGQKSHSLWAVDLPGDQAFHVGDLHLLSNFFRSDFGDRKLFFKHTITEEDINFRPELGRICPSQIDGGPQCSPCPQTFDCFSSSWLSGLINATLVAQSLAQPQPIQPVSVESQPPVSITAADVPYLRYYLDADFRQSTTRVAPAIISEFNRKDSAPTAE